MLYSCDRDFATKEAYLAFLEEKTKQDRDLDLLLTAICWRNSKRTQRNIRSTRANGATGSSGRFRRECEVALFASGWGDGYYPTYFAIREVSGIYIQFIDIERTYTEDNEA